MSYGGGPPFPYRGKRERDFEGQSPDGKRQRRDPPGCTVWLGNLPWEATDRDVTDLFGRCGAL